MIIATTLRLSRLAMFGLATAGASAFSPIAANAQETIKIGAVIEVTGRLAAYGEAGKRGIEMAMDAFGNRTIGGRKVELVFRDVQSDPQYVISAVNELTNSGQVNYMIGPCVASLISAAIPAWRQKKPVWMQFCGTSDKLKEEIGSEDHFFHTFPYGSIYQDASSEALKYYLKPGAKAAVIFSDDDFGRGQIDALEKFYAKQGIEIVAKEVARVGTTDFNPVLTKLARLKPDVLTAIVQGGDLVTLAKQIYARKFPTSYRVGGGAVQFGNFAKAVGPEVQEGWIGPTTYLPGTVREGDPRFPDLLPSSKEWEERFRARYNRDPDQLDVGSYVSMIMLLIALQQAGTDDPQKVVAELGKLDLKTPLGRGKFEETEGTKHQAFAKMVVFQRQKENPVIVYPPDLAQSKMIADQVKE